MKRIGPRAFTIALLAQVVVCLVVAPILAAERCFAPKTPTDHPDSRPIVQAAFDATDVRPEEVSDAGRKRGKAQSKNRNCSQGVRVDRSRTFSGLACEARAQGGRAASSMPNAPQAGPLNGVSRNAWQIYDESRLAPPVAAFWNSSTYIPSVQPTGPPTI